jgi:hypothetical protein
MKFASSVFRCVPLFIMTAPSTANAQTPCNDQKNDLQMMNDMNYDIGQANWPMIPTGFGAGKVVDLRGQVLDFKVISDNGGLLDCTLLLQRQQGEEKVRIRYWKNIAGQLLHEVTFAR